MLPVFLLGTMSFLAMLSFRVALPGDGSCLACLLPISMLFALTSVHIARARKYTGIIEKDVQDKGWR